MAVENQSPDEVCKVESVQRSSTSFAWIIAACISDQIVGAPQQTLPLDFIVNLNKNAELSLYELDKRTILDPLLSLFEKF